MIATITGTWVKVEAGHYILTTDDGYTATVRKDERGGGGLWMWTAEAVSPTGRTTESHQWHDSMADAREWAVGDGYHLPWGAPDNGINRLRREDAA